MSAMLGKRFARWLGRPPSVEAQVAHRTRLEAEVDGAWLDLGTPDRCRYVRPLWYCTWLGRLDGRTGTVTDLRVSIDGHVLPLGNVLDYQVPMPLDGGTLSVHLPVEFHVADPA